MTITFPCWRCGQEIEFQYEPAHRVFCDECKQVDEADHEALIAENALIRKRVMFDKALRMMEAGGVYMHEYREIAASMKERLLTDEFQFRSSDEVMAAMVLESYNIKYEANKRIEKRVVDFFIPSMHICLEIDGDRHKWSQIKDSRRDIALRDHLGPEWEVIHITTSYFEKRPERLVDALDRLYDEKKRLRHQNHGVLPEYYSRREMEHYATLTPKRKER